MVVVVVSLVDVRVRQICQEFRFLVGETFEYGGRVAEHRVGFGFGFGFG